MIISYTHKFYTEYLNVHSSLFHKLLNLFNLNELLLISSYLLFMNEYCN